MQDLYQRIKALPIHKQQLLSRKLRDWMEAGRPLGHHAKALAVFYVSKENLTSEDVKAFLKARLPKHMLPVEYTRLDALPKTINGKVDRSALQKFQGDYRRTEKKAHVVFSGEAEEQMAGIWGRVLNVPVDADDNFFELGGHSLLATQVIMEIEEVLGLNVPLNAIFKFPTVTQLCRYLESEGPSLTVKRATPEAAHQDLVPLSNAQRRLWYISQMSERGLEYKIVKVLDMQGSLNVPALEQGIAEIVRRHESLRTCFGYVAGQLVQKVCPPESLAISHVDLTLLSPQTAEWAYQRIENDVVLRDFDLDHGPLVRLTLLRYSHSHARLIFDVHHIVVDGWSFGVLVRELNRLFKKFSQGLPSDLEPLPAQYRDYALWEIENRGKADLDRQLGYWLNSLSDLPTLEFKRDAAALNGTDGELNFEFDRDLCRRISETCIRMKSTLFSFLTSAFFVLLYKDTGLLDIAIGTDVANRDSKRYANLIGFFVNQLVLRIKATAGMRFADLWRRTADCIQSAFAHKDLPYDNLVRALRAKSKDKDRDSLFRAKLVLHHDIPDISIAGIETSFIDAGLRMTKFDLLVNVEEGKDGLRGKFEYRGALFDEARIRRMSAQFTTLCDQATRDLDTPLDILCGRLPVADVEISSRDLEEMHTHRRRGLHRLLTPRES